jgi:TM2 domain-containing membrane protein YozV
MPFDGQAPPKIYCTACGTPHHEDCYMENGGCTVFGCTRAPADDPKLQVSYSDLNAVAQPSAPLQPQTPLSQFPSPYGGPLGLSQTAPATTAAPSSPAQPPAGLVAQPPGTIGSLPASPVGSAYPQPEPAAGRSPKSRTTFILLGIFLGMLGIHNFYAGYTAKAVGQLCLSVLTLGFLAAASWIWAIVEICIVEKDSAGIQFS